MYDEEPLPADSPLRDRESAVLGPHVAGSPSWTRLAGAVVADLERFAAGGGPRGRVSRARYEGTTDNSLR